MLCQISNDNNKIKRKKIDKGNIKKLYIKRNIFINLLEIVIILLLFPLFFSKEFSYKLITLQFDSEIKLTIKGAGNQYILNTGINNSQKYEGPLPNQLFINGVSEIINNAMIYNFKEEYNNITLIWNSPLNSTSFMFYGVSNITKIVVSHFDSTNLKDIRYMFNEIELLEFIDLSNLDTSNVTDMRELFKNCKSLISLDLSNFKTSNVTNMTGMFYNCKSLKSLDLSTFITSKVVYMTSMFYECQSLISLNLSNFKTSNVTDMMLMFYNCTSLESIELSNLDTSNVTSMNSMFKDCKSLISLDLSNFKTSKVTNMNQMFSNCKSLESIDLSNLDTSNVRDMSIMFENCESLISLDLSSFITSKVVFMSSMFYECQSLISLDLSNLDTSNVRDMSMMFFKCKSLISLDLSNFKTSKVTYMSSMFAFCESLIYLNLKSFTEESLFDFSLIFYLIRNNTIYCIDENKAPNIASEIKSISSHKNCLDSCFLQPAIFLVNQNKCISCYEQNISFQYKYNNKCVQSCPKRTRISLYNNYSCIDLHCQKYYNYNQTDCLEEIPEGYFLNDSYLKTIDKCNYYYSGKCFSECINDTNNNKLVCTDLFELYEIFCFMQDLCIYCYNGTGYYPFYNQTILNNNTFTECYKELEGYFLDYDNVNKPCFNTCKSCSNEGNETNNNCIKCKDNYRFLNDSQTNVNNCYEKCDENYYYFDSLNKYQCTDECPNGYKLIKEKNKCIDNCSKDDEYHYEFNNSCLRECPAYYYEFNNICLEFQDSVAISNLNIINSDSVVNSNLNIINSDSVVNSNLNIKNTDSVVNSNLNIKNTDNVVNSNLNIKNTDIVVNSNLNIKNTDNVVNSNLNIKNTDSVVYSNLNIKKTDSVVNSNLNIKNTDSVVNSNLNIINSDSVVNSNLNIINTDSVVNSNLNIKNTGNVVNSNLNIKNTDSVVNSNLNIKNTDSIDNNNLNIKNSDSVVNSNSNKININEKGECPKDFPYKLQNDIECIKECNVTNIFNGICIINNTDSTVKDDIVNNIRSGLLNHTMDELLKDVIDGKKEDLIIVQGNTKYTLTTSDNKKNNEKKNESTINLGECENKLKEHYKNININDSLLIFKIDNFENGSEYPIIEYEIYNSKTKEKLDLNYCKDTKIQINIPAKINEENEFKYNPASEYYNDICFTYTTEDGTDINLKDRKNEFFNKNYSICESNCDYGGYDSKLGKATCECNIKIKIPLMSEIVINKDLLRSKFVDIKKYINLNVMKCYNILLSKKGLLFNIGSYTCLSIIFSNIILLISFIFKGYKKLFDKIYEIKKGSISYKNNEIMNNNDIIKTTGNSKKKKKIIKKTNKNTNKKIIKKTNKKKKKKKNKKNNSDIKEPPKKYKNKNKITNNNDSKAIKLNTSEVKVQLKISQKIINYKDSSHNNISVLNSNNKKIKNSKKQNKNFIYYNDYEINTLKYKEALKVDKRTYPQYYFSLLRMRYLLVFTFFAKNDYNSKTIKICLFLFIFSLYFTVNSLFFSDSTMHKIYIDKGSYNFIYQIPQIVYSSIISGAINSIVSYFSLSEKNIILLKKAPFITEKNVVNLIKCLKIKFFVFFIIEFSLLFLFWYYLSCFCAVYINTQTHLFKDTLLSFGLSLIYPLLLYLLPVIFRITSLRAKNGNKECLYNISQILQII